MSTTVPVADHVSPPATPRSACTGRELARMRLALGVSVHAVAGALSVKDITLARWELHPLPVPTERLDLWQRALATVAHERAEQLARAGFRRGDLPHDLNRTLAAYGAYTSIGEPHAPRSPIAASAALTAQAGGE